jgi:NAD(P)-dependent dehydrogenase (short-subunit alcohol dehydrogenase family)
MRWLRTRGHGRSRMRAVAVAAAAIACAGLLHYSAPFLFRIGFRLASCPLDVDTGDAPPLPSDPAALGTLLRGRRTLVVGGTRGIGRGIALTLARAGASVHIVGRGDGQAVVRTMGELHAAAAKQQQLPPPLPVFRSHAFDLSTAASCMSLAKELAGTLEEGAKFDYVFFTVGVWPNFSDRFTADGVDRVVALDLLARHQLIERLAELNALRPGARLMNTLAPTQAFPLETLGIDTAWIQDCLSGSFSNVAGSNAVGGKSLFSSLVPVAVAADAYLQHAAQRHPALSFVGMFPGVWPTAAALPVALDSLPPHTQS